MRGEREPVQVAWRHHQDWVLPSSAVRVIAIVAAVLFIVGLVFVSVGSGTSSRLMSGGVVLAGMGVCGLLVCLLLCLHACFLFRVQDRAVQTEDSLWQEEEGGDHHHPVPLPLLSSLKAKVGGGDLPWQRYQQAPPGGQGNKKSVSYSGEESWGPTHALTLNQGSWDPPHALSLNQESWDPPRALSLNQESWGRPPHALNQESWGRPPRALTLKQLIEENDYDVPVDRRPELVPPAFPHGGRGAAPWRQEVGDNSGSVQSAWRQEVGDNSGSV
ncbi:hypothetical protein ACOMHN_045841 [Nucella lapillus]